MTDGQKKRFQRYVRALRRDCRTSLPVKVRRRNIRPSEIKEIGYKIDGFITSSEDGTHILMILDKQCAYSTLIDTLVHEWAHAMVFPTHKHGKMWGKAFALAYVAFEHEVTRIRDERGGR